MQPRTIHHFGPDPAYVGGMASVIRILAEHRIGGESIEIHPTWIPHSIIATARRTLVAAWIILKMERHQIVHIHLSERGSFLREGALVILAKYRNLTPVITIHGATFSAFARNQTLLVSIVLRRAKVITCLDQEVLRFVRMAAPRVKSEVVPNPMPMDFDSPGAGSTNEIVVFAGEIGLRKGADVLHRAWQIVAERRPKARCIMVGPIKDFVVPPTERLEVRDPVDSGEMRKLLRRARVVALPSRAEGMPMILTEAMSAGRPFVSTSVGGIPDLAVEGGILVKVDDPFELAECLVDLLGHPNVAQNLGDRGRQFCLETRSVDVIDARFRELYAQATLMP